MSRNIEELTEGEVLREFVKDCEKAFPREGKRTTADRLRGSGEGEPDWFDLADVYEKAKHVLAKTARMIPDAKKPLKIKRFLRRGEISDEVTNVGDLYYEMGNLLDSAYASDIFGEVVFEAEDGVFYVATVEGVIGRVNPKYLQELLADEESQEDDA